ncbi:hypothetical protein RM844_17900 [Streptomyces sp. DSM 44915]|uniref:Phage holin family protein n=1 Tax=Streptomyces chisholmiae TaxID=3075540 RepID=A0ABU2JUF9_9ACTN|nr:hypothetical protein [Streptomyces sp. DSM 44915]MDT0268159.1 hypothetical protein [Streptomyces sp. DSM 44915]
MQVFRRRDVPPGLPASSDTAPGPEESAPDRAPTAHDITLRAMGSDVELERLLRLERRRNHALIWSFVIKTAATVAAVLLVWYAASGIGDLVWEQVWPLVSVVGAALVTSVTGWLVARVRGRRAGDAPAEGAGGDATPPSTDGP